MKSLVGILCALLVLVATACGNVSENLEKMIPADATGVVCINVPEILKKSTILADGKLQVPPRLAAVIDDNDESVLCEVITDLPRMGIDPDSRAYAFFTSKTFASVLLVSLNDEAAARRAMERRSGTDFTAVDGLDCIYVKDNFYAVAGRVLFWGRVNKNVPVEKAAAAARAMLNRSHKNILDNEQVKACLEAEGDVNAYLEMKAVKSLLHKSATYRELSQKMPLLDIFTESDIRAMTCHVNLLDHEAQLSTTILADDDSQYMQLMNTLAADPDAAVLKAVPNSMDYTVSMSVKGDRLVQLPQVRQLIGLFKNIPYIGRIDIESILSSINGPLTVGVARDPHLDGEWNAVVAAKSTRPEEILKTIGAFATMLGQAPEIYDGEYIYQYDNKMIKMGVTDGVLYAKMLDYEQTEGYAHELATVRNLFAKSQIALFAQTNGREANGKFEFGMTDHRNGVGRFYCDDAGANATLELLRVLCAIRSAAPYDDAGDADDEDLSSVIGTAIDRLQPVH